MRSFPPPSRGFIVYIILAIIVVLGIFGTYFHQLSRYGQAVFFRLERTELARIVSSEALDEAFLHLQLQTTSPGTPEFEWLLRRDQRGLPLPVPLAQQAGERLFRSSVQPSISVEAYLLNDFRGNDPNGNRFYGCPRSGPPVEGVGTIELRARVELENRSARKLEALFHEVRHHDYKVVSVSSARESGRPRDQYAQNFLLDYSFFVRNALSEFEEGSGYSLNNQKVRLLLDQSGIPPESMGKVFFGGTGQDPDTRFVFLNVPESLEKLIPAQKPTEILRINHGECLDLFQNLKWQLQNRGINEDRLRGLEGVFTAATVPVRRSSYDGPLGEVEKFSGSMLGLLGPGPLGNLEPGIELVPQARLSDTLYAQAAFEGRIRQRFHYFVHFQLDLSKVDPEIAALFKDLDKPYPCIPFPPVPPADETIRNFLVRLPVIQSRHSLLDLPLISSLDSDFLYRPNLQFPESRKNPGKFEKPVFFNRSGSPTTESNDGPDGLQPFFHVNLWGRRMLDQKDLIETGIYDPNQGEVRPQGVVWVEGPLSFGREGSTLSINGQGVILSHSGIEIKGDIRKAGPNDLLILATRRGSIKVGSSNVEASLIAVGNSGRGTVIPSGPFNLLGAFAVDRLNLNSWAPGTYTFSYDPHLMGKADRFAIHLSPAISFQQGHEGE